MTELGKGSSFRLGTENLTGECLSTACSYPRTPISF